MTLEQQILIKLKILGDTELNRVARAFARIRFGDRFKWIDGLGYNDEGKPIGWRPDVFVRMAEGNLDRIEATTTSDRSRIWKDGANSEHFAKILGKIASLKTGGGLVYVAGHPDVQFNDNVLREMEDAAVSAGLSRELVEIIGSDALADALSQPEMASVRIGMLGVGNPRYFNLVQRGVAPDRARLIRAGLDNPFIPTAEDLDADTVYFPDLGAEVERRLLTQRVALVRGLGASGKSVLAWLLGLRWQRAGAPAYYLSLRNFPSGSDTATQDLTTELTLFAADTALFTVDDCHLNEEAARRIYSSWQELAGSRPALLLIGRETRSRKGSRIHELDLEPLPLRARQDEVRGVFMRLAARYLRVQNDTAPLEPPPRDALDRWVSTFGGDPTGSTTTTDLIAFSAAVQRRIGPLLRGDWTLREEHAAEEMREHYLRPLSDGERQNLILLSALQKYEIALPASLLPAKPQGLQTSIENSGIVFSRRGGFENADTFFQLAHAALGKLILIASEEHVDEAAAFRALAARHGDLALTAHRRLMTAGEDQIATVVALAALANPRLLNRMSLQSCKTYLQLAEQLRSQPEAQTALRFLASPEGASAILPSPINSLNSLADFFHYLEGSKNAALQSLYENLADQLADSGLDTIVTAALESPLHFTADFLRYLEGSDSASLRRLHSDLARKLAHASRLDTFVTEAAESSLHLTAAFLRYLEGAESLSLQRLYSGLADKLADPSRLETLVTAAMQNPLNETVIFLRYLEGAESTSLQRLYSSLADKLADPSRLGTLVTAAFESSLHFTADLLRYLEGAKSATLRSLHSGLADKLVNPDRLEMLVAMAVRSPLNDTVNLLRYLEGAKGAKSANFRQLHSDLADRLAEPARLESLLETASRFSLHMLVDFFRYLNSSIALRRHALTKASLEHLCAPRDVQAWAAWALRSPADQLEGFLNYARNRGAFDRLVAALANECRAGTAHAEVLAEKAMIMLQTGAIAGELGDHRTARREIGRVLSLFGGGKAPALRAVIEEALEQETLFRKGSAMSPE